MKIKPLEVSKTYVPEWNGNLLLPLHERVAVTLKRFPTAIERSELLETIKKDNGDTKVNWDFHKALFFVKEIENLFIGEKEIKTAQELTAAVEPAVYGLIIELTAYLISGSSGISEGESTA